MSICVQWSQQKKTEAITFMIIMMLVMKPSSDWGDLETKELKTGR